MTFQKLWWSDSANMQSNDERLCQKIYEERPIIHQLAITTDQPRSTRTRRFLWGELFRSDGLCRINRSGRARNSPVSYLSRASAGRGPPWVSVGHRLWVSQEIFCELQRTHDGTPAREPRPRSDLDSSNVKQPTIRPTTVV